MLPVDQMSVGDPALPLLTPSHLRSYFVDKTRDNLHIVLAMSPIGDAFRERLRQFPSLVNCCTIDWWARAAWLGRDGVGAD